MFVESRAHEPIVPLQLFRLRTFTASVIAIFLAAMGFFAAVVFLPRWFQFVNASSATEAGYQLLPLVGGLIISAVGSGQFVARTGRYKTLIIVALLAMAVGLFLMTNLRPDTPLPLLCAVDVHRGPRRRAILRGLHARGAELRADRDLGTGTSSLTLFQQVGGTIGLAITGTIFGSNAARGGAEAAGRGRGAAGVRQPVREWRLDVSSTS